MALGVDTTLTWHLPVSAFIGCGAQPQRRMRGGLQ
jgi:hypothetical protein